MSRYVDICIQPIPKKSISQYRKLTTAIGKLLVKHGALSSQDYVAEDENAVMHSFPKRITLKKGEVLIYALAEFKSKAHRTKVFKLMEKDPQMAKIDMSPSYIDPKRAVIGGFKLLVDVRKKK